MNAKNHLNSHTNGEELGFKPWSRRSTKQI